MIFFYTRLGRSWRLSRRGGQGFCTAVFPPATGTPAADAALALHGDSRRLRVAALLQAPFAAHPFPPPEARGLRILQYSLPHAFVLARGPCLPSPASYAGPSPFHSHGRGLLAFGYSRTHECIDEKATEKATAIPHFQPYDAFPVAQSQRGGAALALCYWFIPFHRSS